MLNTQETKDFLVSQSSQKDTAQESWHLDKKVPIALIGTILINIVVGAGFMVKQDLRITQLEVEQAEQKKELAKLTDFDRYSEKFMSRIEENLRNNTDLLNRILNRLEK